MKQKLMEQKGEIDKSAITVGDFTLQPLYGINKTFRLKISEDSITNKILIGLHI